MSICVALQSVCFYYLSCSTCSKINQRHKTKKQAKRERIEKQKLETEQPGIYRHPSPYSTNPFWTEEIMLGPQGVQKPRKGKNGSKNGSSRALNSSGPGSSIVSGTTSTDAGSNSTMVISGHRMSGEDWNRKRYQREDEILWGQKGHTGHKLMDALARAGNSVGISDRILGGLLTKSTAPNEEDEEEEEDNIESYYIARNPPLNDLHPPIVSSQPTHKGATRWMLQPPPPAKVMEGKERANRDRSNSSTSSRKGAESANLARQVSSRLVEAKLKRGETPEQGSSSLSLLDPISKPKAAFIPGKDWQDRKRSSSQSSSSSSEGTARPKRRPPPLSISLPIGSKDIAEHVPVPTKPSEKSTKFRLAPETRDSISRPALSTIASSSLSIPKASNKESVDSSKPNSSQQKERSSSEQSKKEPAKVVIPKVHHSFQGKETFVFPPPANSKVGENGRPDYDTDYEDEEEWKPSPNMRHSLDI